MKRKGNWEIPGVFSGEMQVGENITHRIHVWIIYLH